MNEKKYEFLVDREDIYCPITKQIYYDPVIIEDGYTYEREAIIEWMHHNAISPLTGSKLNNKLFIHNKWLKNRINEMLLLDEGLKKEQYQLQNNITLDEVLSLKLGEINAKLIDVNRVVLGTIQSHNYKKFKNMLKTTSNNISNNNYVINIINKVEFSLEHGDIGLMFASHILNYGSDNVVLYMLNKLSKDDIDYYNSSDVSNYGKFIFDICKNHGEMINILINKGVNIDIKNKHGHTILHEICLYSSYDSINILFKNKSVDIHKYINSEDKDGDTPIFYACENIDNDLIIRYLIENGADINKKSKSDYFIHRYIVQKNILSQHFDIEMLKYLKNMGINMDVIDMHGNNPIYYICDIKNVTREIVEIFSENTENLYHKNNNGDNLLHMLFTSNPDLSLVKFLIETKNIPYNVENNEGYTPIHILCDNISDEKSKRILKYICSMDHQALHITTDMGTPLDLLLYNL